MCIRDSAGAEHIGLIAVLDLDLPFHAVEPLLPFMGIQLVRGLAGGAHGDDERVHMTGGTARRQAEVGQVAGVLGGCLLYTSIPRWFAQGS